MRDETAAGFNFTVDHMTLLVAPGMYKVAYAIFRIVFGVPKKGIIYEKRRKWPGEEHAVSMTFAAEIGGGPAPLHSELVKTVIAVVQPSEPQDRPSHVRRMLQEHGATAHWQHIALKVDDLLAFHRHALAHGVNFITPILHDEREDLLQVFSGEWYLPESNPTGLFFEFVQRDPSPETIKKIAGMDREAWFRDKAFTGLYEEKEKEYQSDRVVPFIDFDLARAINGLIGQKEPWSITEEDLEKVEKTMSQYAEKKPEVCP
jgi:hypothetical protein